MTIEELKQWLLQSIKRCKSQAKCYVAEEKIYCKVAYDSKADAYNEVYQKLCIYFGEDINEVYGE